MAPEVSAAVKAIDGLTAGAEVIQQASVEQAIPTTDGVFEIGSSAAYDFRVNVQEPVVSTTANSTIGESQPAQSEVSQLQLATERLAKAQSEYNEWFWRQRPKAGQLWQNIPVINELRAAREAFKKAQAYQEAIQQSVNVKLQVADPVGGIDLNAANLDLRIKRDGKGVPLPLSNQDMNQLMSIEGFVPVIINIKPMLNTPILSELIKT